MRYLLAALLLFAGRHVLAANVVKTIGASGADYTTVAAWAADLDDGTNAAINTTAYGSGDVAIGELIDAAYNQTSAATISGGGTVGLSQIILRPASGNKHDGTFGSGCVVTCSTAAGGFIVVETNVNITVEDLELSGVGVTTFSHSHLIWHKSGTATLTVQRCLLKSDGVARTNGLSCRGIFSNINNTSGTTRVLNCVLKDFDASPDSSYGSAIYIEFSGNVEIDNCTITGCYDAVYGAPFSATCSVRNTVVMGSVNADFTDTSRWDTITTVLTGDGSIGTQTTQTTSELFTDASGGDCTPTTGSDLIDAGTDLGTTPTGVNIDAKGRDRDSEGDTWDVGAIESVSGGSSNPNPITPSIPGGTPDPLKRGPIP